MKSKMTIEDYFNDITNPLAYYKVSKDALNKNIDHFTKMYKSGLSSVWAIWLMDLELIKELENEK